MDERKSKGDWKGKRYRKEGRSREKRGRVGKEVRSREREEK